MTAWTPDDTLRAADRVQEASRREATARAHMRTAAEAGALDVKLAEMQRENRAAIEALDAIAAARENEPKKPTGRKRTRTPRSK